MWIPSWVRKVLWRRKWQPIPVFLPEKPHGQRSLVGYSQSVGLQRVGHDLATEHTHSNTVDATGLHSQYDRNSNKESLILDRDIQERIQEETALE